MKTSKVINCNNQLYLVNVNLVSIDESVAEKLLLGFGVDCLHYTVGEDSNNTYYYDHDNNYEE